MWKKMLAMLLTVLVVCTGMSVSAKADVDDFGYEKTDGGMMITYYDGMDLEVEIPSKLGGSPVVEIGEYAFFANLDAEKIIVPKTVTRIDDYAFSYCWELREVVLPDSVTTLGTGAFSVCAELVSAQIPKNVKVLPAELFDTCASLTEVSLPEGLLTIGEGAFNLCGALTEISLPKTLTAIKADAFANCESLSVVTIPKSVTEIGDHAFGYEKSANGKYKAAGITIKGYKGTAAETYAKKNGFEFIDMTPAALSFRDVKETDWFYDSVREVYELGIMTGNSAGTLFTPDGVMTRGMIVNVLYRLDGSPKTTYQAGFKDVDARKYYATSVNWAVKNAIVKGYSDNTFRPDNQITREQMVIILYYYAKYLGMDVSKSTDLSVYKDSAKVSSYAAAPVKWAVANGIMSGSSSKQLNPQQSVTRAQAARMLAEFNHLKVAAGK